MKRIYIIAYLFLVSQALFFTSCKKADEYKKFFNGGEITYAGRADTVIAHSGNERIQLSVILGNDPLVTKVKAFWNDGKDSVEQTVVRTLNKDTVNLIVDKLTEGSYNFNVYTYDKSNNSSVILNASGVVYGLSYSSSLVNRRMSGITYNLNGSEVYLNWANANIGEVGIELEYTGSNGEDIVIIIPNTELKTTLTDYKEDTRLKYRTMYMPDSSSIDTFKVARVEVGLPVFERQFDKTRFKLLVLPTDATTAHGWVMTNMWDGKYDNGFATINRMPQWFTFDMGTTASINRFKAWQAQDRLYAQQNMKKFEIWGSNSPDADGSWDSWTKLADCESIKPSGLPLGENSSDDLIYAKAGEEFLLPSGSPKVRYIRIKVLDTWGKGQFVTIGEVTFYTKDR